MRRGEKYPSLRLTFPNTYFEPNTATDLFKRYFDECGYVDDMGFDGIMVNEHHNTPSCMNASCNLSAAVLARTTKQAKILLLGNILPIHDNPVRLAEEIAMIDVISGGRVISGMVRGTGVETLATNGNPMYNRERFEECHDLVIKTWTTPGPFRWEGKHYNFRVVNPWMVPAQKPHPPVWVPGTASPETAQWAAQHGYTYVAFLTPLDVTEDLFQIYRSTAAENSYEPTPDNFGYLLCCYVADTQEEGGRTGAALHLAHGHHDAGAAGVHEPGGLPDAAGGAGGGAASGPSADSAELRGTERELSHCGRHARHGAGENPVSVRPAGDGAPDFLRPGVADVPRGDDEEHWPVREGSAAGDTEVVGVGLGANRRKVS